ncbi:MAG: MFS transporter [Solirubrobacteraceae bacterium]
MTNLGEIRRVLRHRDFRMLWLAQSASVIGDNIVLVALALFVIERTGSATDLGLVLAAQALPLVTFLLIGGVWADRLPRHRVMIATDLVRFTLHALLAVLIFAGRVPIWQLVVIEMLFRTAEAFFRPAANGLLPQTIPEADIQPATAVTTISNNVAEFVGPALATALVLGAGAGWAFALDAATFLVSAAFLSRVRPPARGAAPATGADAQRPGVWASIREGSREVRSRVWVWATLASFCVALFCGLSSWYVLGPVVAREQYGHIAVYGVVESAIGFGTVIGALAGVGWRPRYPMRLGMLATLLWPLAAILYAAGITLLVVVPASVLAGAGFALFDVWWLTALAERIPPQALSRVTSFDWMVSLGLLPLGYAVMGPLASQLGAVNVLLGGSALGAVAFALGLLPRETRMLERLREGPAVVEIEDAPTGLARRS